MPRVSLNQTSFTAGEISPKALGRTDIDRYGQAVRSALNVHAVVQGGMQRRAGSRFIEEVPGFERGFLVPFVASREQSYMLCWIGSAVRIFEPDGTFVVELASPYTSPHTQIDWAQSGSVMYLFCATVPIYQLERLESGTWTLSLARISTQPFGEVGVIASMDCTLSAATVGVGRTATAASAIFQAADVGRAIISDTGIGVITGFTSGTVVTIEITRAFPSTALLANAWEIEGSPQTAITPSDDGPVGATITLTAAASAWDTGDVGAFVRLNAGLVRITGYTSATVVSAFIVRELNATTAAPALAWSIEYPAWSAARGYPRTGTIYQQRLWAGGTRRQPRSVWGSRVGEPLDFELGTDDDAAFSFTIDSNESSAIAYIVSSPDMVVLTESGEYSVRGGIEKPITATNIRVKQESNHGCAAVRPTLVGREALFVQRSGRKIRALGYRYDFDGYSAPDVTALAEHITGRGVLSMAYQQEPNPLVWAVRSDGKVAACLFDRDQQPSIVAWSLHDFGPGVVEYVASLPNSDVGDQLWISMRRVRSSGGEFRSIERLDDSVPAFFPMDIPDGPEYGMLVDAGVIRSDSGHTTVTGLAHLTGSEVDIVCDGSVMPRQTVVAGAVTLPRSAKQTQVGLPFRSEIGLLTPEFGTGSGSAQGNSARTGEITMRFHNTIGAKVVDSDGQEQTVPFRRFGSGVLNGAPELFSGLMRLSKLGWKRGESDLTVVQTQPMPMHLLSVARKHSVND